MKFPVKEIIANQENKYIIATAMIKYAKKIEEIPEILLKYPPEEQEYRLKIIMHDIINGEVKYKFTEPEGE